MTVKKQSRKRNILLFFSFLFLRGFVTYCFSRAGERVPPLRNLHVYSTVPLRPFQDKARTQPLTKTVQNHPTLKPSSPQHKTIQYHKEKLQKKKKKEKKMMHQPRRQQLTADLWAKAGELEKQFASYKKKVEKSDQAKDESTLREKRDGGRGEYYERYMRIRDVKLRQQLSLRIERKQSEMTAMWEKLEKSRAEMTVRFGGGTVGRAGLRPVPVRTPSPSAPKKTVQVR